ncbi:AAA family ATPase [Nakamurella flava]|uniref:AAA family ATPase n=1 Tax=Nakamurella flava TaxID=2576308 RepID=A0A4U6QIV8_9ACTN|nr:DEAD/DEAH box helicase [Nakamurella flava]TKV60367.1 AAA family ATPase [Nakamurella flava]
MSDARGQDDRLRVLQFWWTSELFSPQSIPTLTSASTRPADRQTVRWSPNEPLPWERLTPPPRLRGTERVWRHTVYLGVYPLEATYESLHHAFGEDRDAYDERPGGESACAALVADQAGFLVPDSVVLSSALWAVGRIRSPGIRDPGWADGFDRAARELLEAVDDFEGRRREKTGSDGPPALDRDAMTGLLAIAHSIAGVDGLTELATAQVVIDSRAISVRREEDAVDTDFLNSFFLDDLRQVRTQVAKGDIGAALAAYLTPEHRVDPGRRLDVVERPAVVEAGVVVERLPPGRWPSEPGHPLALSQQFAVNQALNDLGPTRGLMGVNGPPGTGKTTMLRDVLAGNVVERARRLASYATTDAAFTPVTHRWNAQDGPPRRVRQLRPELTGFEMVVASANNAAVENVTTEIPADKAIAKCWQGSADYFGSLATEILKASAKDQPEEAPPLTAWGLVAARLGNRKNRSDFRSTFWFDKKDPRTKETVPGSVPAMQTRLQQWHRGQVPHRTWGQARELFDQSYQRVLSLTAERRRAQERLRRLQPLRDEERSNIERIARDREALAAIERAWADGHASMIHADSVRAAAVDNHDRQLMAKPGVLEIIFSFGAALRKWRPELDRLGQALRDAQDRHHRATALCDQLRQSAERSRADLQSAEQRAQRIRQELKILQVDLSTDESRYGLCYPGSGWTGDARELHAPWLDAELDTARSELFLAALRLHEDFLACAASDLLDGLRAAVEVVAGSVPPKLEDEKRRAAWQLFFFVVPLISTTFASVGRMMTGLGREALGWLFIDEAGQASPQYAVGSIWRAQRVLAVGDPLQLQPVVTIPPKAQRDIAGFYRVSGVWLPPRASVQTLADRVAATGTFLPQGDDQVWVSAPLRVHRRCDDPMFGVSNRIAYGNIMVNGVRRKSDKFGDEDAEKLVWPSFWANTAAVQAGTHVQPGQMERLRGALSYVSGMDIPLSEVIAISPFREVADRLAALAHEYPGLRAGTIHTAQGREADVVILVLGGDPSRPGAQVWASSSPNLVNVAVSRAKRRLYVIGDRDAWGRYPHFRELAQALPTR